MSACSTLSCCHGRGRARPKPFSTRLTPHADSCGHVECVGVASVIGFITVDNCHHAGALASHYGCHHACCHDPSIQPSSSGGSRERDESVGAGLIVGKHAVGEYPPVKGRRTTVSAGATPGPSISERERESTVGAGEKWILSFFVFQKMLK